MIRRILAITQALDDPATRYRIGLYQPLAAARSVQMVIEPWPRDEAARQTLIARAADFDSVVIQRRLMPTRYVKKLRQTAKFLAFDFDDAVIYRDSTRGRPWLLFDKVWQFRALIQCCDAVTAGNDSLATLAGRYGAKEYIRVVPTVVDTARYASAAGPRAGNVLGWIGHRGTAPYLRQLAEPLAELMRRRAGLCLHCIADCLPVMPGTRAMLRPWSEAGEVTELQQLDLGLAPLPDDSWTRGKCGLRLLQYLAAGVPAVASPVGVQSEIIASGAALSATSAEEWIAAIEKILTDADARSALIARGRKLVEEKYRPQAWIDTVLNVWTGENA